MEGSASFGPRMGRVEGSASFGPRMGRVEGSASFGPRMGRVKGRRGLFSDGAILSLPQHSPMCCHLSHQGHPTALTFVRTTWTATPPLISALSRVLCV